MKNKLLFIIDPWQNLRLYRDSSMQMVRAAIRKGYQCEICIGEDLIVEHFSGNTSKVFANALIVEDPGTTSGKPMQVSKKVYRRSLNDYLAVINRKDPPVNGGYMMMLWSLRQAKINGAVIINDPAAVLTHSEKSSIMEFSEFVLPTIITGNQDEINKFIEKYEEVVIKPLDSCNSNGVNIYSIKQGKKELKELMSIYTEGHLLMVQKFLPNFAEGDARVFIVGGKVLPKVVHKFPVDAKARKNISQDVTYKIRPINASELKIAETLAPIFYKRGLFLVGLDVFEDKLFEINVTSPACMVGAEEIGGFMVTEIVIDEIVKYAHKMHKKNGS